MNGGNEAEDTIENAREGSFSYKSMLNTTLGLENFEYLFEDDNDDESFLASPVTISGESGENIEKAKVVEISNRNFELQNEWETQQNETKQLDFTLSALEKKLNQQEQQWKKERDKLLSSSPPAIENRTINKSLLKIEREKRMQLEVECRALKQQLKQSSPLSSSPLRTETLKQLQKKHTEEIQKLNLYSQKLENDLGSELEKKQRLENERNLLKQDLEIRDVKIEKLKQALESLKMQRIEEKQELEHLRGEQQKKQQLQNEMNILQTKLHEEKQKTLDMEDRFQQSSGWKEQLEEIQQQIKEAIKTKESEYRVKDLQDKLLSPIPPSASPNSEAHYENVERNIDGLLEEIGQLDLEREALLNDVKKDVSTSQDFGTDSQDTQEESSEIKVVPKEIQHGIEENCSNHLTDQATLTSEADLTYHSSGGNSNDALEKTLMLLNNLKELMDGQCDEDEKEASVLQQLEVFSEMMQAESSFFDRKLQEIEEKDERFTKQLSSFEPDTIESSIPTVEKHYSEAAAIHLQDHNDPSLSQEDEDNPWPALLNELRRRCQYLEHDRSELARISNEMIEQERESQKLKLSAALATTNREYREKIFIVQSSTRQQIKTLYHSLCVSCQQKCSKLV
jgi:hypothetical protein